MKHLKSDKYYHDFYDLLTIKDCLRLEKQFATPLKPTKKIKVSCVRTLPAYYSKEVLEYPHKLSVKKIIELNNNSLKEVKKYLC